MNNEEKNVLENEASAENINTEEKPAKKLSTGALIGIIGGAVAVVAIVVVLVILLAGGEKCDAHVDADDDYKCDKCGAEYDDGEEVKPVVSNEIDVSFKLQLDNGKALSGIEFTLVRGEKSFKLVSGADGSVNQKLDPGPYSIEYNYDSLPEYCMPDTFGVKIEQGTATVTLVITDNKPDGSANKPFPINENNTEITIAPGSEVFYSYRGSAIRHINIPTEGIDINYNGNTYTSSEGSVSALIKPEIGMVSIFSLKNTTTESISTTMTLVAPLGSNENPHVMTSDAVTVDATSDETVFFKWIANKNGVLVLSCDVDKNNLSLTKSIENNVSITTQTDGSNSAYMLVSEGDSVLIGVSMLEAEDKVSVPFSVKIYDGTDSEPVPVPKNEIDLSFGANDSIVFELAADFTDMILSVSDEGSVTVIHGNESYIGGMDNDISVELTSARFTITNSSDYTNGISFSIFKKVG